MEKLNDQFEYNKERDDFKVQAERIQSRPLVKFCYDTWYDCFQHDIQSVPQSRTTPQILELGSGGSYFDSRFPDVITSDVVPGVGKMTIDGRSLPFGNHELDAIVASHVFHHIPDVELFLQECERVLRPGGCLSLIEVAHTPLSKIIFKHFHPEPYDENRREWKFDSRGNMDANQALSWMVFVRDRSLFEKKFPTLKIETISYLPWLTYLFSGGVTKPSLIPYWLAPTFIVLEKILKPLRFLGALHWHIRIRKTS